MPNILFVKRALITVNNIKRYCRYIKSQDADVKEVVVTLIFFMFFFYKM